MITRDLLRHQVERAIVELILEGRLPGQSRINESTLSAELGVSRTPLREALMSLQQEGFVEAQPGRGFHVVALSSREVREVYPIVAALEGLAMRQSDPRPDTAEAARVNDAIAASQDDPERCLELDSRFHQLLVRNCDNTRLLEMHAGLRRIMNRYETAYMRRTAGHDDAPRTVAMSVSEHRVILDALARGDLDFAATAIELNWRRGMERLLEILDESGDHPA